MRRLLATALLATLATSAQAQRAPPPIITLRVEQPAYTGMPIWLRVLVHDECLEQPSEPYPWYKYLWLRDDGAEVIHNSYPVPRTPFTDVDVQHMIRVPGLRACPRSGPPGPEHDIRFALSGAYVFDQPGHYKVRWTTEDNYPGQNIQNDVSAWFDFDVQQSTPEQRKAWLDAMLPQDSMPDTGPPANIVTDYIPALVSAWRDPRVTRKLLDLTCSGMKDVNIAASEALHYDLDQDAAAYFANLVTKGCHWRESLMAHFILRHARELTGVRGQLLHGLAAHFDKPHPDGDELQDAIWAMAVVRINVPGGATAGAENAWADAEIVRVGSVLTSPHDYGGMNYTQVAVGGLTNYLTRPNLTPPEHALLRKIAADDMGLEALDVLIRLKDPADLAFFGTRLAHIRDRVWGNYLTDIDTLVNDFGTRATPMLRTIATDGNTFELRDKAAFELIELGQPDGESAISTAMQSTLWLERRDAANGLDDLVKRRIPIGSLAHFCTGPEEDDPCRAHEITTPPGMCEPHVLCRVHRIPNPPPTLPH